MEELKTEGKVSKVAICENCHGYVLAAHTDYIDKQSKKEFMELSDDGFTIKTETIEDTKERHLAFYTYCIAKTCSPDDKEKQKREIEEEAD